MSEKPPVFKPDLGPESNEFIEASALLYDGRVFRGITHGEAFEALETSIPKWEDEDHDSPIEGFITNTGRFVDRKEAGSLAKKSGQLSNLKDFEQEEAADSLDSVDLRESTNREQDGSGWIEPEEFDKWSE